MTLFNAIIGGTGAAGWVFLAATSLDSVAVVVYLVLAAVAAIPLAAYVSERRSTT